MRVGYLTDKGNRRPKNEDAVKVLMNKNFFMLADGVGGNKSGEIASQAALDALENFLKHNPIEGIAGRDEMFRYFDAAVKYVNQFIIKLSDTQPSYAGMATTLVFAYIVKDNMYIANIGDSRVYLLHDADITQVTEDHTYVNDLVRMGAISKEEALTHSRKNVITRAIGANAYSNPDCFEIKIAQGDKVLICSDGLYDEVGESVILSRMMKDDDMKRCAEDLVAMANSNGGNDNISLICISLVED